MSARDYDHSRTDLVPSIGNPAHAERAESLLDAIADAPAPVFARCPTVRPDGTQCIGSCDYGRDTCNRCRLRAEDRARRPSTRVYEPRSGFARYSRGVGR